jgi:hypothetical protein
MSVPVSFENKARFISVCLMTMLLLLLQETVKAVLSENIYIYMYIMWWQ